MALFGDKRRSAKSDPDTTCANCGGRTVVQVIDLVRATELVCCPSCGARRNRAVTGRHLTPAR